MDEHPPHERRGQAAFERLRAAERGKLYPLSPLPDAARVFSASICRRSSRFVAG